MNITDKTSNVKFIKKTTSQKCPCGYEFLREEKLRVEKVPSNLITCEPGLGPVVHRHSTKTDTISSDVLKGDKVFVYVSDDFMACPECGTVLLRSIAEKITKE